MLPFCLAMRETYRSGEGGHSDPPAQAAIDQWAVLDVRAGVGLPRWPLMSRGNAFPWLRASRRGWLELLEEMNGAGGKARGPSLPAERTSRPGTTLPERGDQAQPRPWTRGQVGVDASSCCPSNPGGTARSPSGGGFVRKVPESPARSGPQPTPGPGPAEPACPLPQLRRIPHIWTDPQSRIIRPKPASRLLTSIRERIEAGRNERPSFANERHLLAPFCGRCACVFA